MSARRQVTAASILPPAGGSRALAHADGTAAPVIYIYIDPTAVTGFLNRWKP